MSAFRSSADPSDDFPKFVGDALSRQVAAIGLDAPRIVVALSGGPDSSALLLALHAIVPDALAVAAHFHHGLRGADANADASYCAALCVRLRLPCVIGLGRVTPDGRSPQDAARRDRYAFLAETAAEYGANLIAVAHTADDQAETVLARVLRGTSIDGLAGIAETREFAPGLFLVRPMLPRSRAEVEAFCAAQGITPRQDPTNFGTKYVRSRLRQRIPEIARDFNPRLGDALRRLAANAAMDSELLRSMAEQLWSEATREAISGESLSLDRAALRNAHAALRRRVLHRALLFLYGPDNTVAREEAATADFVDALDRMLAGGSGRVSLPGGDRVAKIDLRGDRLELFRVPAHRSPQQLPFSAPLAIPGIVTVAGSGTADRTIEAERRTRTDDLPPFTRRARRIAIDARCAAGGLRVRSPQPGDVIAPLGLGGHTQSVRDVCANAKLPALERGTIPLVVRADDPSTVLWIVGLVQSEATRVTEETQEVVVLTAN